MWEQQHELGTQKILEGRRQHMWMVHAIGRTRPSKVANSTHSSFTYKELQERLDCEQ